MDGGDEDDLRPDIVFCLMQNLGMSHIKKSRKSKSSYVERKFGDVVELLHNMYHGLPEGVSHYLIPSDYQELLRFYS